MAHIRQCRPDSCLGFQFKAVETFLGVPSSLGSGFLNTRVVTLPNFGAPLYIGVPHRVTRWEGFREGRRCSRATYPESSITEYTLVDED